ncbi:MAG: hypothetical protein LKG11_01115 [Bacilli bacterium]|jgi:hypothetical protein|nr:hypothetical protein [Bacilli bacterium]
MKTGVSPNNVKWHERANLAMARDIYEHDEYNDIKTGGLDGKPLGNGKETFGYSDGDLGSSLQATKNEGNIGLASRKKVSNAAMAAGVAGILAVSVFALIQGAVPELTDVEVSTIRSGVSYSFFATCSFEATVKVGIEERDDIEKQIYSFTGFNSLATIECAGTFEPLESGTYTLTVVASTMVGTRPLLSESVTIE